MLDSLESPHLFSKFNALYTLLTFLLPRFLNLSNQTIVFPCVNGNGWLLIMCVIKHTSLAQNTVVCIHTSPPIPLIDNEWPISIENMSRIANKFETQNSTWSYCFDDKEYLDLTLCGCELPTRHLFFFQKGIPSIS